MLNKYVHLVTTTIQVSINAALALTAAIHLYGKT